MHSNRNSELLKTGSGQVSANLRTGTGDSRQNEQLRRFASLLVKARNELGWTQEKLAEHAECSVGTVKNAERCVRIRPGSRERMVQAVNQARENRKPPLHPVDFCDQYEDSQSHSDHGILSTSHGATHEPLGPELERNAEVPVTANDLAVFETLESMCSVSKYHLRDIASTEELRRLWLIDCAAYDDRAISFPQFVAQWHAFPHFPKALFNQDDIAAAIGIMPMTRERMQEFVGGRITESDLQNFDLSPFLSGGVDVWLIDGIVRNPRYARHVTRELICSSVMSWIEDGLIKYPVTVYAIGQNRDGMNLIVRAGFKLVATSFALPDKLPLYSIEFNSEAQILRLLFKRLHVHSV